MASSSTTTVSSSTASSSIFSSPPLEGYATDGKRRDERRREASSRRDNDDNDNVAKNDGHAESSLSSSTSPSFSRNHRDRQARSGTCSRRHRRRSLGWVRWLAPSALLSLAGLRFRDRWLEADFADRAMGPALSWADGWATPVRLLSMLLLAARVTVRDGGPTAMDARSAAVLAAVILLSAVHYIIEGHPFQKRGLESSPSKSSCFKLEGAPDQFRPGGARQGVSKARTAIVLAFRGVAYPIAAAVCFSRWIPNSLTESRSLVPFLVTSTGLSQVVALAFLMPLPCLLGIPLQAASVALLALMLGPAACQEAMAHDAGREGMLWAWRAMSAASRAVLNAVLLQEVEEVSAPEPTAACGHVTGSLYALIGVLLPCYALWAIEYSARARHASSMASKRKCGGHWAAGYNEGCDGEVERQQEEGEEEEEPEKWSPLRSSLLHHGLMLAVVCAVAWEGMARLFIDPTTRCFVVNGVRSCRIGE